MSTSRSSVSENCFLADDGLRGGAAKTLLPRDRPDPRRFSGDEQLPAAGERFVVRRPSVYAESPAFYSVAPRSSIGVGTGTRNDNDSIGIEDDGSEDGMRTRPAAQLEAPGVRRSANGMPLAEFGPLEVFVADPRVTDVFVNGPTEVWVDFGAGVIRHELPELDETSLRALTIRLVGVGGRHIDESTPCVDVRLYDGIRVHAVLPPISTRGTLLSIRLPNVIPLGLDDLHKSGFFAQVPLEAVHDCVARRTNLLLTGAAGSGKTTLLAAILASAPPGDRIIAVEDVSELRVDHPHFLALEARQANLEGAGKISLDRLLREALRMRPDRLVLGECRGAEIRELLTALNTGHDGGAGTLHANSLNDVPARLEALGALAGMSATAVARQAVSAIGMVLHLERDRDSRHLADIGRLEIDDHDRLKMTRVSWQAESAGAMSGIRE